MISYREWHIFHNLWRKETKHFFFDKNWQVPEILNRAREMHFCLQSALVVDDVRVIDANGRVLSYKTELIPWCTFTPSGTSSFNSGITIVVDSFSLFPVESEKQTISEKKKKISDIRINVYNFPLNYQPPGSVLFGHLSCSFVRKEHVLHLWTQSHTFQNT